MDDWYGRGDALVDELAAEAAESAEDDDDGLTIETLSLVDDDGIDDELEDITSTVERALPVEGLQVQEELVKDNLEELLLVLIGLHGEAHGKELMSNVAQLTGAQLSPGTLYPILHELESEGVLEMHKKVRTKAYTIDDPEAAVQEIERSMIEHLSFGLLQYAFLSKYRNR